MHTLHVKLSTFGDVSINHNSDWSGEAIVTWYDPPFKDEVEFHQAMESGAFAQIKERSRLVKLPAALLIAVSQSAARSKLRSDLISFMEEWGYGKDRLP